MTIRANAFTYFPFVLPCVFDSNSPCPYPGVNVDLYNVAMRPYRVMDGGTEYTRVGREGSTTDSCDGPDGSYASLRCNRTDLSMNLFYLVDEALLRQFDMSMAVDMDRKFIVVPRVRKSNLVPFIRMFEPSAWIAVLIMIFLHRVALRARRFPHATRFYLAVSHFAFFFLRCRTESSIVSGWLQDLVLSPLVSEANHLKQLAVGIREGQVKMAFSHSSRERLTQTASGKLRRVIDAVIDTPDSYFVLPTGMSCLEAVAAAARRNLQGYGVQHVVTETSENNIQHLRCQDKRYVHGFYHLTANLAFAFRKGSRIRENFDKRLWTTLAATGTHEFVNSRKRLYWRSHDCGDANDPSLVKPKPVKPVQMKTAYTVSGAGFLLALVLLLGEFLHHRTAAAMEIRASGFPYYPYISECVFNESLCSRLKRFRYPGVNIEMFEIVTRALNWTTIYSKVSDAGPPRGCETASHSDVKLRLLDDLVCNNSDITLNLFYLTNTDLVTKYDISPAVDTNEITIFVPKTTKGAAEGFHDLMRHVDYRLGIMLLFLLFMYKLVTYFAHNHRQSLKTIFILCTGLISCLMRPRIESEVVDHVVESLMLQPIYNTQWRQRDITAKIAEQIRTGDVKISFNRITMTRILKTRPPNLIPIIDAIERFPDRVLINETGVDQVQAVANSAYARLRGETTPFVVTETAAINYAQINCQGRQHVHGFKEVTAHLAFGFQKNSKFLEPFNIKLLQIFANGGNYDFFKNRKRRYILKDACDADHGLAKPSSVKLTEVRQHYLYLAGGLCTAPAILLVEMMNAFLHRRNSRRETKTTPNKVTAQLIECIFNKTLCTRLERFVYPGMNMEMYEIVARALNWTTVYRQVPKVGGAPLGCDKVSNLDELSCNRSDVALNLFYLTNTDLVTKYDISPAVDANEITLFVPKARKAAAQSIDDIIRYVDYRVGIIFLCLFIVYKLVTHSAHYTHSIHTIFIICSGLISCFIRPRIESAVVDYVVESILLQPLFITQFRQDIIEEIAVKIENGDLMISFTEIAKGRMLKTRPADLLPIINAIEKFPNRVLINETGVDQVQAVADSAYARLRGERTPFVVTETAAYDYLQLDCKVLVQFQSRQHVHGFKQTTKHLAFGFQKNSKFAEPFNSQLLQTFHNGGPFDFFQNRKRRYTPKDACDEKQLGFVKPEQVKFSQVRLHHLCLAGGLFISTCVLLLEILELLPDIVFGLVK